MNEETVLYRLDSIDKQLAELVELSKQTALQEVRIAQTEKDIRMVQDDVAGIDGNLSVATSTVYVQETVTEAIDDLDELADLDF